MAYATTCYALRIALEAAVENRGGRFVETPEFTEHIDTAARWLCGRGRVGLMMAGGIGNGKTTLMKAIGGLFDYYTVYADIDINKNTPLRVEMVHATELARLNRDDYGKYKKLCDCPLLALDDLGQEPAEVLDFGNVDTPAANLLCVRYEKQLPTMVTTNLSATGKDNLRSRYGDRVADRVNEMFNVLAFKSPTFRRAAGKIRE